MSHKIALFAGSFDPFTRGHYAVVESALRLFDEVVIGVGCNISKCSLLSIEQRCRLIEDLYATDARVRVQRYDTLTVDFAREIGATAIVRGLRNSLDMESERVLERVNRELCPELQAIMVFTPAELTHISSSCVRELLAFGRGVESMMPEGVDINKYIDLK